MQNKVLLSQRNQQCKNIEYVNPKFTETTGYSLEEVVGKISGILKNQGIQQLRYENL
jgi:PAS domain S-box-containing protein